MAREISTRLEAKGILECLTPIHVGGTGDSVESDMVLAENGKGDYYIPGTSFAGCLRQYTRECNDNTLEKELWGYQCGDEGQAGSVFVEDLVVLGDVLIEIRFGVAIDRNYGNAADQAKFDRMILPKGTKLGFQIVSDATSDDQSSNFQRHVLELLGALKAGDVKIGAGKTRGLGRIQLVEEEFCFHKYKLDSVEGIRRFLSGNPEVVSDYAKLNEPDERSDLLKIEIEWSGTTPVMVKTGFDGIGVDTLPLVSAVGDQKVAPVIPGSSIKGALRNHAEKIVRTMIGGKAEDDVHDQINLPLINELFGAKNQKSANDMKGSLGALQIDDCFSKEVIKEDHWMKVESAKVERDTSYAATEVHKAIRTVDLGKEPNSEELAKATRKFSNVHHTAIDRFTGAAADNALFSVLKPSTSIKWEPIRIDLNTAKLGENTNACLALLLLTLKDFSAGMIPLGFAVNRGMGQIEVSSISGKGGIEFEIEEGNIEMTNADLQKSIAADWKSWIDNHKTEQSTELT